MSTITSFEADRKIPRELNRTQLRDMSVEAMQRAFTLAEEGNWQGAVNATTTAMNAISNIRRRFQNGGGGSSSPFGNIALNQGLCVNGELRYWRTEGTTYRQVIEYNEENNQVILSVDKIGVRALTKELDGETITAFEHPAFAVVGVPA